VSLDPEQEIAFRLAGTVGLPSPYPATGSVEIVAWVAEGGQPVEVFLRVIHRLSFQVRIARLVDLDSIRAIYAPWESVSSPPSIISQPAPPPSPKGWTIKTAKTIREEVLHRIAEEKKSKERVVIRWLPAAIVYVPEAVPVLMNVETGMTAAESAEYYPPLTPRCVDRDVTACRHDE
jgi:hypothetical protein